MMQARLPPAGSQCHIYHRKFGPGGCWPNGDEMEGMVRQRRFYCRPGFVFGRLPWFESRWPAHGVEIGGALLAVAMLASVALSGAHACEPGDEACPVILRMARGEVSVTGRGSVSGSHPNFFFKFGARAGQKMTIRVVGQNLKTGAGIPITLPNGADDAIDENAPYTLPQTGDYRLEIHANTMSDGPFGPFILTLTIE
jgi:hypothetical protein